MTVWAEDHSPGAWIVAQDCEFQRSNRTSQLWEFVEVCRLANSNAYNQSCPPTCKRSEYIQDNQCVQCPAGQFSEDNQCRWCPAHQYWSALEGSCFFCPDGKEVTDDGLSCEDETFLGLTEIQWAAIGTALAACSLLAGAFLTLRKCRQIYADKQKSTEPNTLPVVQAAPISPAKSVQSLSTPNPSVPFEDKPSNPAVGDASKTSDAAASPPGEHMVEVYF